MMNKELEQAIEYFKNRNSFSCVVSATPQFKTILKYYQIVYENWQECESELNRYKKFVNSIEVNEKHNLTILNETELKELKKEIIERQETENSLTKWVSELTDEFEEFVTETGLLLGKHEIMPTSRMVEISKKILEAQKD
jgi:hypothetical protein